LKVLCISETPIGVIAGRLLRVGATMTIFENEHRQGNIVDMYPRKAGQVIQPGVVDEAVFLGHHELEVAALAPGALNELSAPHAEAHARI